MHEAFFAWLVFKRNITTLHIFRRACARQLTRVHWIVCILVGFINRHVSFVVNQKRAELSSNHSIYTIQWFRKHPTFLIRILNRMAVVVARTASITWGEKSEKESQTSERNERGNRFLSRLKWALEKSSGRARTAVKLSPSQSLR